MNASRYVFSLLVAAFTFGVAHAADPYDKVVVTVNEKVVKLFGAGGFRGAESFGTGIIISPKGHILTTAGPILDGRDLRLHLPDGRKFAYKVKVIEPEFDAAILEIIHPDADVADKYGPYGKVTTAFVAGQAPPTRLVFNQASPSAKTRPISRPSIRWLHSQK